MLQFSPPFALLLLCVCALIKREKLFFSCFFSGSHHSLFDIVYMYHIFLLFLLLHIIIVAVVLESKTEEPFNKRHVYSILNKRNQHTLPYPCSAYFISFHFFLYSNPCFSFFTIFTDNTLKRSFVFKKQTKKAQTFAFVFFVFLFIFDHIFQIKDDHRKRYRRRTSTTFRTFECVESIRIACI